MTGKGQTYNTPKVIGPRKAQEAAQKRNTQPQPPVETPSFSADPEALRKSALEAMNLCKRIYLEAMAAKETFNFDDQNIDALISMTMASEIDPNKNYGEPEVLLSLDGAPIFVAGDFSIVEGKAKSRKTFLLTLLASLFLSKESRKGTLFETSKDIGKVLWIDTEQGMRRTKRIYDNLKSLTGSDGEVAFYSMRELGAVSRMKAIALLIAYHRPKLIVLDGVADLVNDVNNLAESNMVIQFLMTFSSVYDCHISAVQHSNEGSMDQTARGHVGKNAMRKCSNVLHCESAGDVTKVSFPKPRDKRPPDFAIAIDNNLPHLTDVPEPESTKQPTAKIQEQYRAMLEYCKEKEKGVQYKELQEVLKEFGVIGKTAERRIKGAVSDGVLVQPKQKGNYYHPDSPALLPF